MLVGATGERIVALLVAASQEEAHGEDVRDKEDVEAEVDVQRLGVARLPDGLEELRNERVASGPRDDCWSA